MSAENNRYSVAGFRSGDNQAWEAFVTDTTPRLRGTLSRMGTRPRDIDDRIQDTYLRLFENRDKLDEEGNIAGYACRTAHNISIDAHRKAYRRHEVNDSDTADDESQTALDLAPTQGDVAESVVHDIYVAGIQPVIEDALSAILPSQRIAIELSADGFTHREIAEETHAPLGTVKTRLNSAKRHLRPALEGEM